MLSPFLSACESFHRFMWFMTCCSASLNFISLDLICPSAGVTWNFLPVHWLIAYLSFTLSWVCLMIGISCIFLKSLFGVCSFTARSDLTFEVHYVLPSSRPYTGPQTTDFGRWDYCNTRLKGKNNTNFVWLDPYLEFEGMRFKVVWESFFLNVLSPH